LSFGDENKRLRWVITSNSADNPIFRDIFEEYPALEVQFKSLDGGGFIVCDWHESASLASGGGFSFRGSE